MPAKTRKPNWQRAATEPPPAAVPDRAKVPAAKVPAADRTVQTSLRAHAQPRAASGTFEPRTGEQAWMQPYLDALVANCGQVVAACKTAGVSRVTVAKYRHIDDVFEAAEKKAMAMAAETAESEAKRRAVDGVRTVERRTWFDKDGKRHSIVRVETKYSDAILLRLLEKQETGSWRQKQQIEHSGGLTFKTRAERKEALEKARAALNQPVTATNSRN